MCKLLEEESGLKNLDKNKKKMIVKCKEAIVDIFKVKLQNSGSVQNPNPQEVEIPKPLTVETLERFEAYCKFYQRTYWLVLGDFNCILKLEEKLGGKMVDFGMVQKLQRMRSKLKKLNKEKFVNIVKKEEEMRLKVSFY
ncbi:hypothetical protein RIF29_20340 [Crotalaria pallida]|uniref:Uncharacterized protein n=1 Tax=Crotalaria pallida TaxID=3830 RepID=A0AAN9F0Y0_CROPI